MADAVQAQQRNLYQTKFAHLEYRDGLVRSQPPPPVNGVCLPDRRPAASLPASPPRRKPPSQPPRLASQGNSYNEQLRQQSWPVVDDVPPQAQPSASAQILAGGYDSLHPNVVRTGGDPSFMQVRRPELRVALATHFLRTCSACYALAVLATHLLRTCYAPRASQLTSCHS